MYSRTVPSGVPISASAVNTPASSLVSPSGPMFTFFESSIITRPSSSSPCFRTAADNARQRHFGGLAGTGQPAEINTNDPRFGTYPASSPPDHAGIASLRGPAAELDYDGTRCEFTSDQLNRC